MRNYFAFNITALLNNNTGITEDKLITNKVVARQSILSLLGIILLISPYQTLQCHYEHLKKTHLLQKLKKL